MIFDKINREKRFINIINNWNDIISIAKDTLRSYSEIIELLKNNKAPYSPIDIGLSREEFYLTVLGAKDLRNRYGIFQ
jgi:hypothetical protein